MAAIFSKLDQITIRLTFLAIYILSKIDAPNYNISSSQHLNDFEIIVYGGHIVFRNEAKIVHRQMFTEQDFP